MEKISLFGAGFVGGNYIEMFSQDGGEIVERNEIQAEYPNILYMISTVNNYHPKDGEPLKDVETNLIHFMKVLSNAKDKFGSDLVFNLTSTWFVYGMTQDLPAKEDSHCVPTGFYSITSLCREQLLQSYAETFGFKWRVLRLGNVIGVGDKKISRKKNALQHMIREVAQGRDIDYLYKGGAIRDYIDVRDCVQAIHLVLEKGEYNQIYNIANGQGLNVNELVNVAWKESSYKSKITHIDVPEFHRTVQTPKMYMDVSKIKNLGYVQQYDIKQSVRSLVHYYEKNEI